MIATLLYVGAVVVLLWRSWKRRASEQEQASPEAGETQDVLRREPMAGMARVRREVWRRGGELAPWTLLAFALVATGEPLIIQKWLGRLIMPVGLMWLASLAFAVVTARRGDLRAASLTFFLFLTAAGNDWVASAMIRWLEAGFEPPSGEPVKKLDAVLVMGGSTSLNPAGSPQLSYSGDRLATAARLYRRGFTARLVCSGTGIGGLHHAHTRDLGREAAAVLADMGVPPRAVITLPGPRNSKEEILAIQRLATERGWAEIGVVTSAWHMRRVMRQAARVGMRLTPLPADFRGFIGAPSIVGCVPSSNALYHSRLALWEIVGSLVGR